MKIKNYATFVLFQNEENKINEIISFLNKRVSSEYKEQNIVIDLHNNISFSLEELLLFLTISNKIRTNNKSFVIINDAINPDDIPDEILVVPTLQEAEDIIEMEEIERELGF